VLTGLRSLRQSVAEDVLTGDKVLVAGKRTGTVHFIGNTEFAPGTQFLCQPRVCELFDDERGGITRPLSVATCECSSNYVDSVEL